MPTKGEVLQRLPFALTLSVGLLGLQLVVLPLTRDWGGVRWALVAAYLLVVLAVAAYFGAHLRARERHQQRRASRSH